MECFSMNNNNNIKQLKKNVHLFFFCHLNVKKKNEHKRIIIIIFVVGWLTKVKLSYTIKFGDLTLTLGAS